MGLCERRLQGPSIRVLITCQKALKIRHGIGQFVCLHLFGAFAIE